MSRHHPIRAAVCCRSPIDRQLFADVLRHGGVEVIGAFPTVEDLSAWMSGWRRRLDRVVITDDVGVWVPLAEQHRDVTWVSVAGPDAPTIKADNVIPLVRPGNGFATLPHWARGVLLDAVTKTAPPQQRLSLDAFTLRVAVLVVSTGGPEALMRVVPQIAVSSTGAVIVAQHIPQSFTPLIVNRLASVAQMPVFEACDGEELLPGTVVIAPGGCDLTVVGKRNRLYAKVHAVSDVSGVKAHPDADLLLGSLAPLCGDRLLTVVMTGMGHDGTRGSRMVRDSGGVVVAQDEMSSTIWGMPGSVVTEGLASEVLPLEAIASRINRFLSVGQ